MFALTPVFSKSFLPCSMFCKILTSCSLLVNHREEFSLLTLFSVTEGQRESFIFALFLKVEGFLWSPKAESMPPMELYGYTSKRTALNAPRVAVAQECYCLSILSLLLWVLP